MNFRVGQKVVCVHDSRGRAMGSYHTGVYRGRPTGLVRGNIYTVTEVFADETWPEALGDVRVLEVHHDLFMDQARFRPLVERKTDISIFQKMLTSNQENVNV